MGPSCWISFHIGKQGQPAYVRCPCHRRSVLGGRARRPAVTVAVSGRGCRWPWLSVLVCLRSPVAVVPVCGCGCGGGVTECLQLENTVSRNSGAHVVAVLVSGGNIRKISHSPDRADSAVETRTCNSNIRSTHSPQKCPRVAVYRSWRCYIKIGVRNKNLVFSGNLAVGVVSFLKYKGISRWDSEGVEFKIFRQSNPRGGGGGC